MTTPIWTPSPERVANANLTRFIEYVHCDITSVVADYSSLYQWSIEHPETFWPAVWKYCDINVSKPWHKVLSDGDKMPGAKWFEGARLNFAENLLRDPNNKRHDKPAIIFWGEDQKRSSLSYKALYHQVAQLAAAMREAGIIKGDRVSGFMPNMPETVVAMLATASIGAIWSSCSPDFGVDGAVDRFEQIKPKMLFTADGYFFKGIAYDSLARVAQITQQLPTLSKIVVVPYATQQPDITTLKNSLLYGDFLEEAQDIAFEQLPFDHPLYILYSSGTTGKPKCLVHGAGGTLLQHLKELVLHTDLKPDDRIFYFTTCGWMMWNWLVSSLASGATVVLYDGFPFYPQADTLFDLAEKEDITIFGASAKYFSALEKADAKPGSSYDLSKLKAILSTGSPLAPESFDYIYRDIKQDVLLSSISGGTDIISCFALGNPVLPVYRGELQCRGLGMKVAVYNEQGHAIRNQKGELVCTAPAPSMPLCFWNDMDNKKYNAAYFERFPNVWAHGDYAELTDHDGIIIYGRSDAVLNPGGVRIGTAEIYRQVEKLPEVLESIAVGQEWKNDVRIILFVKLREGLTLTEKLSAQINNNIRESTTPRHVPARIIQVADIPRTISGKIVELAARNVIHNRPVANKEALANPEALEYFRNLPELQLSD